MDRSERIGFGVSATGHIALIAVLALGLLHWSTPAPVPPPAMEVALTDRIAMESRATTHEEAQTAQAPELGPSEPDAAPPEQALAKPEPKPVPKPDKAQEAKPDKSKPQTKADLAKAMQELAKADKNKPRRAAMLGDVLKGLDAPTKSDSTSTAASGNAPLSPEAARALRAEITRQLKPYWRAPTGVDADKLITVLTWRLNPDGTLASGPTLVKQDGKTASNFPQQQLHIEAAIRAVRAATPFKLPPDLYDSWKYVKEFSFDKRL
jgi:type IV secretory pathway VirB10-like protein